MFGIRLLPCFLLLFITLLGCVPDHSRQEDIRPVTVIEVEAENWRFNKEIYKVFAGKPITINFKSVEGHHGFGIKGFPEYNIEGEGSMKVTLEPGEYQIFCTVPCGEGHDDMVATLIAV
ncbi:cytochrome C oxidase subunit II [Pseudalkalibacillus sp. SCS-8]|uniref:cytochrome C oxidase subunit II n=1 Tax=Pseudalkalibacillus nanhaiensis TaxID=3115291 RepID=UPI0032D9E97D